MRTKCKTKGRRSTAARERVDGDVNLEILQGLGLSEPVRSQSSLIDSLRFKLVCRDGKHIFTEVRVGSASVTDREKLAILVLLNGEPLETLSAHHISTILGKSRHVGVLQDMISELQAVLCA